MTKVLLVGVNTQSDDNYQISMEELKGLAEACDMESVGMVVQNMPMIHKSLYIGTGKVAEVRELADELGAELVLFNDSLTPSQLKNLQDETGVSVMDRTTLILEIFAQRAKSREAILQVEVARLQYLMPRLIGLHDALTRQGGTSGSMSSRGAGEKKLELDRRRIAHHLTELKKELKEVEQQRSVQQKKREKSQLRRVALVGYTNAGKSTIMNALLDMYSRDEETEDKKVFAKDMLFATLDTTVRKITTESQKSFLLSDTVGFIDRLPHGLVEAFHSTLSEAAASDLILHVIDFSDPNYKDHIRVTKETLKEIGASDVPVLYVYNKADMATDEEMTLPKITPESIYLSAKNQQGLKELTDEICKRVYSDQKKCELLIPYAKGDLFSYLKENTSVYSFEYEADGTKVVADLSAADYGRMQEYIISE